MKCTVFVRTRDFNEIDQFIDHHLSLGFDNIVIYDNFSTLSVTSDNPKVEVIRWGTINQNCNMQNDYVLKYCNNSGWTAFLDEDEFINTDGKSIQECLEEYKDFDAVVMSWRLFGDKIDDDNKSNNMVEKYRYYIPLETDQKVNWNVKTICKNDSIDKFQNPHIPILKENKTLVNVNKETVIGFLSTPIHKKLWIDHYHCRGIENYIKRKSIILPNQNLTIDEINKRYYYHNNLATKKLD